MDGLEAHHRIARAACWRLDEARASLFVRSFLLLVGAAFTTCLRLFKDGGGLVEDGGGALAAAVVRLSVSLIVLLLKHYKRYTINRLGLVYSY